MAHHWSAAPHLLALSLCVATSLACERPDALPPPTEHGSLTSEQALELEDFMRGALERYGMPGAALVVLREGAAAYTAGFGVLGVDDTRPVTAHTQFMVGSLTKGMTSWTMATLADEGRLDWDERVADFWPEFALSDPASTPRIRVRDLVNHSSGVPRHDTPLDLEYLPPTALISSLREIPTVAPPGEAFGYSNQMYATGGFAAAYLAGAKYEDAALAAGYERLMRERVFEALGMQRTTLDFAAAIGDGDHAWPHGYDPALDAVVPVPIGLERFTHSTEPAGAVWSDATDMAHYLHAQLTGTAPDGRRLVSERNLGETHTTNISLGDGTSYALGWFVEDDYLGVHSLWHDGGTAGFSSNLLLLPEQHAGVLVLANRSVGAAFYTAVTQFAAETLLGREHASDDDALAVETDLRDTLRGIVAQTSPIQPSDVTAYLGSYEHHARVSLSAQGLALEVDFGTLPLLSTGVPGEFVTGGIITGLLVARFDTSAATPLLTLGSLGPTDLEQVVELRRLSPQPSIVQAP